VAALATLLCCVCWNISLLGSAYLSLNIGKEVRKEVDKRAEEEADKEVEKVANKKLTRR
jgi:hypothetical protein